jgi:hypothetical protein
MTIHDVYILNWEPPGAPWWSSIEARPDEQLIQLKMTATMSMNEYRRLCDEAEAGKPLGQEATPLARQLAASIEHERRKRAKELVGG